MAENSSDPTKMDFVESDDEFEVAACVHRQLGLVTFATAKARPRGPCITACSAQSERT